MGGQGGQVSRCPGLVLIGEAVEIQRSGIGCLGMYRLAFQVPRLAGSRIYVSAVPVGLGFLVTLPQGGGIVVTADGFGHDGGHLHHVDVDGIVHQVCRGTVIQGQPVCQARCLGRQVRILVAGLVEGHAIEPVHHGFHVLPNDLRVAILDVHLPGHLANGCSPGGSGSEGRIVGAVVSGHGGADAAGHLGVISYALVGPQGHHPLAVEILGVGIVDAGAGIGLGVTRPAHTLVALRAVRGDGEKVAQLAALDVLEQLVHQGAGLAVGGGGYVPARRDLRRGEHQALHILQRKRPFVGRKGHLHILITAVSS